MSDTTEGMDTRTLERRLNDYTGGILGFGHLDGNRITWQRRDGSQGIIISQEYLPGRIVYGLYTRPEPGDLPGLAYSSDSHDGELLFGSLELEGDDDEEKRKQRAAWYARRMKSEFAGHRGPYDAVFIPYAITDAQLQQNQKAPHHNMAEWKHLITMEHMPWSIILDKYFAPEIALHYDCEERSLATKRSRSERRRDAELPLA